MHAALISAWPLLLSDDPPPGGFGLHRHRTRQYWSGKAGLAIPAGVATNDASTSSAGSVSGSGRGRLSTTPPIAQALSRSACSNASCWRLAHADAGADAATPVHACVLALAASRGFCTYPRLPYHHLDRLVLCLAFACSSLLCLQLPSCMRLRASPACMCSRPSHSPGVAFVCLREVLSHCSLLLLLAQ